MPEVKNTAEEISEESKAAARKHIRIAVQALSKSFEDVRAQAAIRSLTEAMGHIAPKPGLL